VSDPFDQDVDDARNTRCPKCDECYQVVRPGKIQPSCACEYIDGILVERDQLRADLAAEREHVRGIRAMLRIECEAAGCNDWPDDLHLADVVEKYLARKLYDDVSKAEAERDELRAKLDGCRGQNFVYSQDADDAERKLAIAVKALGPFAAYLDACVALEPGDNVCSYYDGGNKESLTYEQFDQARRALAEIGEGQ
jgi:hypothetical protein